MPKTYDRHKCMVCGSDIYNLQIISGIPWRMNAAGRVDQLYGHYQCVCHEIGSEKLMRAVQLGLLPIIREESMIDGMLKSMAKHRDEAAAEDLNKVYEFIGS